MTLGSNLQVYPISRQEALKIQKRKKILNKATLYTSVLSILGLAAESIYRNNGGDLTLSKDIFEYTSLGLIGSISVAFINNFASGVIISKEETKENKNLEKIIS